MIEPQRGQLVLLAAVAIAVAVLPLLAMVGQLGYHPDGAARAVDPHPATAGEAVLERAVANVAADLPGAYPWAERQRAAATARRELAPTVAAVNRSLVGEGTVLETTLNATLARTWERANCPGGPARRFGPCRTDGGLILQERAGRTHLVAVAVDIAGTGPAEQWEVSFVLRPR